MAIAHSTTTTATAASASSTTISSFVVTGADPILVLKVATKGSGVTVTGATWNGSENFVEEITDINGDARSTLLYLANPTTTTADIVVTLSGGSRHVSAVSLYTGVDQTSPVRVSASANGTNATATVSITKALLEIAVDSLSQVSAGPDTATASHTQRSNTAATGGGSDTRGASQETGYGAGLASMSWTMSSTDNWATCAMTLREPLGSDFEVTTNAPDALAISGKTASLIHNVNINAGTDALSVSGKKAAITYDVNIAAVTAALVVSGKTATITHNVNIEANTYAMALDGKLASIVIGGSTFQAAWAFGSNEIIQ